MVIPGMSGNGRRGDGRVHDTRLASAPPTFKLLQDKGRGFDG